MNVTLHISSLKTGGAERVVCRLANYWATRGHRVSVITIWDETHDFYKLDPRVTRGVTGHVGMNIPLLRGLCQRIRTILSLRAFMKRVSPDIFISFVTKNNLMAIAAAAGTGVPVIVSDRTNREARCGPVLKLLQRLLYPRAARFVALSRGVESDYLWLPPEKRRVIYNPLPDEVMEGDPDFPASVAGRRRFVAVGRLVWQKAHNILIDAFARIADELPQWDLVIAGEGPLRGELQEQIERNGLTGRIALPGAVREVRALMRSANIFVFPSRCEGFGNALAEAMAEGCAVISADCDYGPAEIVTDGHDGVLVPVDDAQAMAQAMRTLAQDEAEAGRLSRNALAVRERYAMETIASEWEALASEIMQERLQ